MGCISAKGWRTTEDGKEYCVYNDDTNACNYGVGISVIAFVASIGFIAGEYLFEQMSSVKTRKHYVLADMGFSGESDGFFSCFSTWNLIICSCHNMPSATLKASVYLVIHLEYLVNFRGQGIGEKKSQADISLSDALALNVLNLIDHDANNHLKLN